MLKFGDPTSCHLWRTDGLPEEKLRAAFDLVERVGDGSHMTKDLYRCKACGQLYFGIWYELIDWSDGDDRTYEIWVPVSGDEDVEQLTQLQPPPVSLDLLSVSPRLQLDTDGAPRLVHWVRKDAQSMTQDQLR